MKVAGLLSITLTLALSMGMVSMAEAKEAEKTPRPSSRYMGGPAELVTAPNGAITNAEALKKLPEIMYLEPTTQEVAEEVWCIGGYSVANTSVIEAEDSLIVYDTGDNKEEARHIRAAIEKISDKPIKVIIYSHSHYALGGGELVDNPEDVMVIGHPTVNDTVQANLRGGGAPSVYGKSVRSSPRGPKSNSSLYRIGDEKKGDFKK